MYSKCHIFSNTINIINIFLILNLPFLLISFISGYERPFFNIDFLILSILSIKFKRAYLLFIFYFFAEILTYILNIYEFLTISDLLYLAQFFLDMPNFYKVQLITLCIGFLILCITVNKIKKFEKIYLIIILFTYISIFLISNRALFFSPFYYLYDNFDYHRMVIKDNIKNTIERNPYASLFDKIKKSNSEKVLVIINESWGSTNDPLLQKKVTSPLLKYKNLLKNYQSGESFFIGGTGIAEFREICNLRPSSISIKKIDNFQKYTTNCLPNYFKNKGYQTISLHGAKLDLYDRKFWYPIVGFKHSYSKENLQALKTCDVFDGICDNEIINKKLLPLLNSQEKMFIHYVTLDTHSPYKKALAANHLNCDLNEESCRNLNLQYEFFENISSAIHQIQNTDIFIIGDHQPPIANKSEANKVFKKNMISWIHFKT